jgi:enamine deaminase RidA (YjgF/YER057c/UK114 family)
MQTFMQVMGQTMSGIAMAWTAIGVAGLGYPGSLVELKAVAVLPNMD